MFSLLDAILEWQVYIHYHTDRLYICLRTDAKDSLVCDHISKSSDCLAWGENLMYSVTCFPRQALLRKEEYDEFYIKESAQESRCPYEFLKSTHVFLFPFTLHELWANIIRAEGFCFEHKQKRSWVQYYTQTLGSTLLKKCQTEPQHREVGWAVLFLAAGHPKVYLRNPFATGWTERGRREKCTGVLPARDLPNRRQVL